MLLWFFALFALVLIWVGSLVLAAFEVVVPMSARIASTVIVVVAVALTLVWRRLRAQRHAKLLEEEILKQSEEQAKIARPDRRAEIAELQRRVQQGIAALKDTKLGRATGRSALYALPWYAIIGPPGAGKTTALKHSGLNFPFLDPGGGGGVKGVGGTRNCDWWFTNEGILLDTAGRYATDDSDREEWLAFLGLLRKHRPEKPINGLLVAISVSDLVEASEEQVLSSARKLRARIDEIMTKLDMVLPVYLIFTKVDLVGGFVEYFGDLKKSERDQAIGATFPLDGTMTADPGQAFSGEFAKICQNVTARALRVIGREPHLENRARIYQFPLELRSLGPSLEQFCNELFMRNAFQENPLFRGFYFTSGTQEGKPFERIVANVARALGIRQAPALRAATEPKSYFVTDVFRKVVFPDRDIAGRTAGELRRRKITQALLAGAAVLIGSAVLFPAISAFAANRDLISSTEGAGQELRSIDWAKPGPATPKVSHLEPARTRLELLDEYEEDGAPLSMRWGLYSGETLRAPLKNAYIDQLTVGMANPVKQKLEFDLGAIGMSAGVPSSQYGKMYDRIKTYVMMTDRAHLDIAWITPRLTELWAQLLQDPSPEAQKAMTPHVRRYAEMVLAGEIPEWTPATKLLDKARSVLLRAPSIERTYDLLVREANEHEAPITRETVFYGSVAPYVTSRAGKKVDGAYTRGGWDHVRKLLTTENSRLEGEKWVLGEAALPSHVVAAQIEHLKKLYYDHHIAAWRDFLQDLVVERPMETTSSFDELNALSEPEWPYLRLLRILHEHTSLPLETNEKTLLEKVEDKLEDKAERLAAKVEGKQAKPQDKEAPRVLTPVERAFLPMTRFAVAESGADPSSTGLAQYQAILGKLIGLMTDLRDSDTPTNTSTLEQEFETAFRATSTLLATQDGFTRPLLSPLLLRPITGAWSGVSHDVGSAAGGLWEVTVYPEWKNKLEPHFPLNAQSLTDAKLTDFISFFKPETGTLWSFYKENLSGQIRRSGDTFVSSTRFASKVEFSPEFLSNCLGRGMKITEAFFDASGEIAFDFQVNLHSVSRNVSRVSLEIDGKSSAYQNTPEEWLLSKWPSTEGSPGARVQIEGDKSLREEIVREGEFGLLRLFAAASDLSPGTAGGSPGGAPTLVATYPFRSERAELKLDIRAKQRLEILSPALFKDYRCPKVITAPRN